MKDYFEDHIMEKWAELKEMITEPAHFPEYITLQNMEQMVWQMDLLKELLKFNELSRNLRELDQPAVDLEREELTLSERRFFARKCNQIYQASALTTFIQNVFASYIRQMEAGYDGLPSEAVNGNINMLFTFLKEYNGFLKQEYDWYQAAEEDQKAPAEA